MKEEKALEGQGLAVRRLWNKFNRGKMLGFLIRSMILVIAITYLTAAAPCPACAQSVAPAASSVAPQPGTNGVTDIFIGRNTKGPYILNWKKIEPGSDIVIRDGVTLSRGKDYQIDYESGMLAFTESLGPNSIARVTYSYTPGKAVANTPGMVLPVSVNMLNRGGWNLQALGLYKEQNPGDPDSAATILGIGGTGTIRSNLLPGGKEISLDTAFLTTAKNGGADEGSGLWDRSGMKLGAKTVVGKLNLFGSYSHAGEDFAGGKEYGLKTGMDIMDIGARMQAAKGVHASFSLRRTEDISGADRGATTEQQREKIVIGQEGTPKFTAMRTTEQSTAADGVLASASQTDTFILEHKFGDKASASALRETRVTLTGTAADTIDTNKLTFAAKPLAGLSLTGSHTISESDLSGGQRATDLSLAASPSKMVSIKGRYFDKETDSGAVEAIRDLRIEAQPLDRMKIWGGYGLRDLGSTYSLSREARLELHPAEYASLAGGYRETETPGDLEKVKDVAAAIKASRYLELSGSYKSRESLMAEDLSSAAMKVALNPAARLKLTGSYESNPEDSSGVVQRLQSRAVGLETRIGTVTLSGGYALRDEYLIGRQSYERQAGLGLTLFGKGRLTTGYRETGSILGSQEATVTYSLGYHHSIGDRFMLSLTGQMTDYQRSFGQSTDQKDYQAEAKLGIKF